MSLLATIAKAAETIVDDGPIQWKVRRVRSREVTDAGQAILLSALSPDVLLEVQGRMKAKEDPDEVYAYMLRRMDPKRVEAAAESAKAKRDAVVVAGTFEVGRDGAFEPVRIVLDEAQHDPENGRVHPRYLGPDTMELLYQAIYTLSTDGGAARERLVAFLARPDGSAGTDGAPGEGVRQVAP